MADDKQYMIQENEKYIEKWRELILKKRARGRDHEVRDAYLEIRDKKLSEKGIKANYNSMNEIKDDREFFDSVFSELEHAVLSKLSKS